MTVIFTGIIDVRINVSSAAIVFLIARVFLGGEKVAGKKGSLGSCREVGERPQTGAGRLQRPRQGIEEGT